MNHMTPPQPEAIAHIDEIFEGASLESLIQEKSTQLIARKNGSCPERPDAPLESLSHCAFVDERELLRFLKQRLAYLQRQA